MYFEPSVNAAVTSIKAIVAESKIPITVSLRTHAPFFFKLMDYYASRYSLSAGFHLALTW